jgi:hypothetical protein
MKIDVSLNDRMYKNKKRVGEQLTGIIKKMK